MSVKTKPGVRWEAVTPDDDSVYSDPPRSLWVGGRGNVSLVGSDGVIAVFEGVQGTLPMSPTRVRATGTTATGIIALW